MDASVGCWCLNQSKELGGGGHGDGPHPRSRTGRGCWGRCWGPRALFCGWGLGWGGHKTPRSGRGPRGHRAGALEKVAVRAVGSEAGDVPHGPCDRGRGGGLWGALGGHKGLCASLLRPVPAPEFPLKAIPAGVLYSEDLGAPATGTGSQAEPSWDGEDPGTRTLNFKHQNRQNERALPPALRRNQTSRAFSVPEEDGSSSHSPQLPPLQKGAVTLPRARMGLCVSTRVIPRALQLWVPRACPRPKRGLSVACQCSAGSWLFFFFFLKVCASPLTV